ncbi:MAG: EAL domain-containing protein [Alicyclobacillaceae bacterium]|nr:EAL domain-containing protein [Alicyclobacillaceae bacterium]
MKALIRWRPRGRNLLSPAAFIPFAEQTGLIWDIGKWVLYTACLQNASWQLQGLPPVRMAVNVSAIQLEHPGFFDLVQSVLADTGLDPAWLELEMTESVLVHRMEQVASVITRLSDLGVRVSVDDFGAGHCSLPYLAYLSADFLKMDQSFIRDMAIPSVQQR